MLCIVENITVLSASWLYIVLLISSARGIVPLPQLQGFNPGLVQSGFIVFVILFVLIHIGGHMICWEIRTPRTTGVVPGMLSK